MANRTPGLPDAVTGQPRARYVFYALVALLLAVAVGHLYLIAGLTGRYLGLPLWAWLQLVVVFAMLGVAWIAVHVVSAATDGGP